MASPTRGRAVSLFHFCIAPAAGRTSGTHRRAEKREEDMKMSSVSEYFGCLVFDDRVMKATLPLKVYRSLKKTIDEDERLDSR